MNHLLTMTATDVLTGRKSMLKTREVCDLLNCDSEALLRLVAAGRIRCIRLSPQMNRFDPEELAADIAALRVVAPPALPAIYGSAAIPIREEDTEVGDLIVAHTGDCCDEEGYPTTHDKSWRVFVVGRKHEGRIRDLSQLTHLGHALDFYRDGTPGTPLEVVDGGAGLCVTFPSNTEFTYVGSVVEGREYNGGTRE